MRSFPRLAVSVLLIFCCAANAAEPTIQVGIEKSGDVFIIDTRFDFPVPLRMAWDVLTDYDNMAGILSNVTSSKVMERDENTLRVQQAGVAKYGIISYSFVSEREVRLEPMKRILARQITGNAKQFSSEMDLTPDGNTTQVRYHAETIPDSALARTFGGAFIQHEVEEQFTAMATEMLRRKTTAP